MISIEQIVYLDVLHILPCVLQHYSNISFDEQQKLKLWSV